MQVCFNGSISIPTVNVTVNREFQSLRSDISRAETVADVRRIFADIRDMSIGGSSPVFTRNETAALQGALKARIREAGLSLL